jgi:mono/diheme cytochrome c family protein
MPTRQLPVISLIAALLAATLFGCSASSLPPGDAARGEARFADTTLGTNGKSCNTCHTEMGRGAKSLAGKQPYDHIIRDCIQGPLQGDPGQEQVIADLLAYIRSLR